jgi:uncharacterized Fe-S cluster-containing MiaB family protein
MTTNWMDYKVGQKVFIPYLEENGNKGEIKISRVGRKYAHLELSKEMSGWVIERGTNKLTDKGAVTLLVYESRKAYIEMQKMRKFRESIRNIEWCKVSEDQINAIAEMLGIES